MATRLRERLAALVAAAVGWRFFKPIVFVACSVPGLWLTVRTYQAFLGSDPTALGVDPSVTLIHESGKTALILLLITLSITPLRRLLGVNRLQSIRRMLGVWSFMYAGLHVSVYLIADQLCYSPATCQVAAIGRDLIKRPFIIVGATAFFILSLLAMTSTTGWQRRLKKNWQRLHRLVYVAAVAAIVHFIWIQKSDIREPLRWGFLLAVLLAVRVVFAIQKRRRARVRLPVTA
jgi:sulfoxide reductase heme-binding subunit YedZ